jgi:hypothetical protein
MKVGITEKTTKAHTFLLIVVALQLYTSRAINVGVSRRETGNIKPSSGPSTEYASLEKIEVQSVTTGDFNLCSKILKSKKEGPTLLVVNAQYIVFILIPRHSSPCRDFMGLNPLTLIPTNVTVVYRECRNF